ncbi:MAG: ATP-binding cassette, subfamily B, bacterial MsbA [Candidatus Peregrinibacteria bacterium Gr01-1014_25]|nr:MAG: ATP-binding cassette, subfamily B, bacterial MsbA [Candidatus Peregrinibacteria bacterium Gr01-1014_25]
MSLLFTILWRSLKDRPRYLIAFIPTMLGLSALWIAEPLYGRYAIDRMLAGMEQGHVPFLRIMAGWVGVYLLINLFQAAMHYLRWAIGHDILARTREHYYARALLLDIHHHVKSRGGALMKTIDNAADSAVDLVRSLFLELPVSIITSLAFMALSFAIAWQLALVIAIVVPLYAIIAAGYIRVTRRDMELSNALWVESMARAYDAVTNIFTVKSSGAEERELDAMRETHSRGIRHLRRANIAGALFEGIGYFMLVRILIVGVGIYLFIHDRMTLGSLFFFQFSFFRIMVPLEMIGKFLPQLNEKIDRVRRGETLLAEPIVVQSDAHAKTLPSFRGEIVLNDVTFSYGDVDALHHIHLHVRAGEHIALVGHSGAGKSTVAMLLNRFYDPTSGTILIDGIDLRALDVQWWRRQIGLVLQENITFNDSILENIRYSRTDATDENVIEAAKRASAHDFISAFPQKYETFVGERGVRLSGGERQRVAIARAILKNPRIVVLDEATSALDSTTERAVQEGIKELIAGRTAFIIAHRLSTVRSVHRIAVLDKGRLIACAPHEELMKTCDIYKEMVELQSHGMLAE